METGLGGLIKPPPSPLPVDVCKRILAELERSELVMRYTRAFGEFAAANIELRTVQASSSHGTLQATGFPSFLRGGETGVPIRVDESVIGFLVIGSAPRKSRLKGRRRTLAVHLLIVFAEHLSLLAADMVLRTSQSEPAAVTRARSFIDENHKEKLSLAAVASAARVSAVHFCRIFKKATGFGVSDYVARLRVERAKVLLLNRGMRVNEIAFAIGFGSIPHFNRVFRRLVGKSPTEYRRGRSEKTQ